MIRKLMRWFKSFRLETEKPITIVRNPIRFTDWKDALNYINKPIICCMVESPDIKGKMEAIRLIYDSEENVTDCYVAIKGNWYGYWKCKPQ